MLRKKRAQSTEFMIAYALGILAIMVVIGVLTRERILSSSQYIPAECNLNPRIRCTDFKINTTGHGTMQIENRFDEAIYDLKLKVGNCDIGNLNEIRNSFAGYINFQNCGKSTEYSRFEVPISLAYKVAGSSSEYSIAGNMLTRIEDGFASVAAIIPEIILPSSELVAPQCSYITYDWQPVTRFANLLRGSTLIWTTSNSLYVGKNNVVAQVFDILNICNYAHLCSNPAFDDLIETNFQFPSQVYPEGSPAGVLDCCALGINPVRANYYTANVIATSPTSDTYINEASQATQYTSVADILIEEGSGTDKVGLMAFSTLTIPLNSKIRDVKLMVTVVPGAQSGGNLSLFNMSSKNWRSGVFLNSPSWDFRAQSVTWPSGDFAATDYYSQDIAASIITPTNPASAVAINFSSPDMISYLNFSVTASPSRLDRINWTLVKIGTGLVDIYSGNEVTVARRPKLFILYETTSGGVSICPVASTTTSVSTTTVPVGPPDNQPITSEYFVTQVNPQIWGSVIIWQDDRDNEWDIYMCNLSKNGQAGGCFIGDQKTRITKDSNKVNQTNPAIYGRNIVWQQDDSGADIYMCDVSLNGAAGGCLEDDAKTRITNDITWDGNPRIYGNSSGRKIVWEKQDLSANPQPGNGYYVYLCEFSKNGANGGCLPSDTKTQVTEDIWGAASCITGITDICSQNNPDIFGNNIVWEDTTVITQTAIARCDLGSSSCSLGAGTTRVTAAASSDHVPKVFRTNITWLNAGTKRIMSCNLQRNGANEGCLQTDLKNMITGLGGAGSVPTRDNPEIYGHIVVWEEYDTGTGKTDIYACDLSRLGQLASATQAAGCPVWASASDSKTRLDNDADFQLQPDVYARNVTWMDYRYGNADIFIHQIP